MGLFILKKNMLRCPKCGGIYEKNDGYTFCISCDCDLITEDEYRSKRRRGAVPRGPVVECPYCHSTDTKKISGISKAGNVAMYGVYATGKISKQWHCNRCNSDF